MANTHSSRFVPASSQYLNRASALGINTNITISAWIRVANTPSSGTTRCAVSVRGTGSKNIYALEYTNNGGTLQFQVRVNRDNTSSHVYAVNQTFTTGTWYHVAMTCDGTTVKGFVDTTEVISQSYPGAGSGSPTGEFRIGYHPWGETSYWDGDIDDVRVYDAARSQANIASDHQQELNGNESNLRGYWKLNNALTDGTSNGYDLTNNNSATFTTDTPSWSTDVTVTPSAVSATFSIPAPTVITDAVVSPAVVAATFSVPAPIVSGAALVTPAAASATFSVPPPTVLIADTTVEAEVASATYSVPAPTVITDAVMTPEPVVATFSVPTPAIEVVAHVTLTPSPVVLTLSVLHPTRIGGLWQNQSRQSTSWTNQERPTA